MSSAKPPSSLWKGKSKANTPVPDDFDPANLSPVITYRHLHSYSLGVKDPLRTIALCDGDAFYAACEQVRLGLDPSLPLVVQQWDSLIAVNYPARKYGISRMCKVKDALQQCPHLTVVHVPTFKEGEAEPGYWENPDMSTHKVSLDYYRRESWRIYHMFKDGLPTGEVEKASIDESFIDFTRPVREEILKRYPYLATVPPDAPDGKDTPLPPPPSISWENLGSLIPVNPPPLPDSKDDTEAEAGVVGEKKEAELVEGEELVSDLEKEGSACDQTAEEDVGTTTWHDIALSIAAEFMGRIRSDIYTKFGYSTSAGIARNKFLAKLTASYRKPNGQSILRNAAIPNYLRPIPFQKIRYLGGKLGVALAQEYDVSLVGNLLSVSLDEMQRKFGEESIWVWEILRGIDRNEVREKPPITKSMLASKHLPLPVTTTSQGYHWIRMLAAELALRLREARESIPTLWPKSIVLHVRQSYDSFRSKQALFPFTRDITVDIIAHAGNKLWKELAGTDATRKTPMKITNLSLSFSGIESAETGQRMIEGFFAGAGKEISKGSDSGSGSPRKPEGKRKRSDEVDDEDVEPSRRYAGHIEEDKVARGNRETLQTATNHLEDQFAYTCSRCGCRLSLPTSFVQNLGPVGGGNVHGNGDTYLVTTVVVEEGFGDEEADAIREALERLRREHDDFHFAQDLQEEGDEPSSMKFKPGDSRLKATSATNGVSSSGSASKGAANKKRKKAEGKPAARGKEAKGNIAQFFVQK
ncbi:hypothetical protein BDY19DRAFT_1055961 [Irpex rosettiformis]|uniref:Uncharacterized protein n=1 Tax=Irpex rosettiformis TaxID=378272 RepID=A0ACB8U8F9_9APHY|nr:hypothetical protein BDY19DRAFT_1055961 [Irpex rosettiformis]